MYLNLSTLNRFANSAAPDCEFKHFAADVCIPSIDKRAIYFLYTLVSAMTISFPIIAYLVKDMRDRPVLPHATPICGEQA